MSETACTCYRDGGAPCAWCAGLPRDRTPAPAAPPEGEAEAILRRKEVRQPCAGKRGDGPWVLAEPAIYLTVRERDTVLAALAAATARADTAQAEAERLRVDGDRRVEAMREAVLDTVRRATFAPGDGRAGWVIGPDSLMDLIRALPATPAPEKCPTCAGIRTLADTDQQGQPVRMPCPACNAATPAPGPSAEGEWIVAESEGGASVGVGVYRSTDGENTRPLVYFGYEEQGTDDEDEAIRRANQRARAVAAALNALTRAPGGQDAE